MSFFELCLNQVSDIFHLLAVPFFTHFHAFFLVLFCKRDFLLSFSITGFGCYKLSTSMFGKKTQDENAKTGNKNIFF
jgi:hypothetical protein